VPPAARVTDMHVCPMVTGIVPHVGGPILPPGAPTVLIDFLPAATVTTMATCVGPPDVIIKGSMGVFINFMPAARMGDLTVHGGVIVMGAPNCIIGEIGSPSPGAGGAAGAGAGMVASVSQSVITVPEVVISDDESSVGGGGGGGGGGGPLLTDDGADAVTKSQRYKKCSDDVKNQIHNKPFSADEKKGIAEVLNKYQPLRKCGNAPLKQFGRTDKMITSNGKCVAETDTMGEWFDDSGTIVLSDAASFPQDFSDPAKQFRGTVAHETAHALLNNFDPRTCKSYANSNDNPLMKEWHHAAGWDATGTVLTETGTDKAPTSYAKTNDKEDLSESMMLYMYDPDKLKAASPARYDFCRRLMGDGA